MFEGHFISSPEFIGETGIATKPRIRPLKGVDGWYVCSDEYDSMAGAGIADSYNSFISLKRVPYEKSSLFVSRIESCMWKEYTGRSVIVRLVDQRPPVLNSKDYNET